MERLIVETIDIDERNVGLKLYRQELLRFAMIWTHEMEQSRSLHGASRIQDLKSCGFGIEIFRKATKSKLY
jgi:hypothetical protein